MHTLFWLGERLTAEQIDKCILAEFPDKNEDPKLYELVKKFMIHGPCGGLNKNCVCMKDGFYFKISEENCS